MMSSTHHHHRLYFLNRTQERQIFVNTRFEHVLDNKKLVPYVYYINLFSPRDEVALK